MLTSRRAWSPRQAISSSSLRRPDDGETATKVPEQIANYPRGQAVLTADQAKAGSPLQAALNAPRVDGFGAEGLPAAAAKLPATAGAARSSFSALPGSLPEKGELAALARPSVAELTQEAVRPMVLPDLYGTDGRLSVPAPLRGTREVLVHQNFMADQAGLERIRDEGHLRSLYAAHRLVAFSAEPGLHFNPELSALRRTARPWTVRFGADTAHAFYEHFHEPLQVNSAVRTVAYQLRLQRSNMNAAAVAGEAASPHLTGQAIDFGKRGMSLPEIAWMRAYLLPLMNTGAIDVEEEFQQACFHVSVYSTYAPAPSRPVARTQFAQMAGESGHASPIVRATPAASAVPGSVESLTGASAVQ